MTKEPVDKHFGIPLSEWIARTPNELEVDAVGLWQLVSVGRSSFDLEGAGLEDFVRRSISELLSRGAKPVRATEGGRWLVQPQYVHGPEDMINRIVSEWLASSVDPDEDGLWFALCDEPTHS